MATWQEQIQAIQQLRQQRNEEDESLHSIQIALIETENALKKLRRKETTPTGRPAGNEEQEETKKRTLEELFATKKTALGTKAEDLRKAIQDLLTDPHPRTIITNLDDSIPILLMPVRIETRFMTAQQQSELWLRIYPDDIAVHTHEKLLTKEETAEGEKYWKVIFDAERNGGVDKDNLKKAAWNNLVIVFGPSRSAWVARQTKPPNWDSAVTTVNALDFPQQGPFRPDAWSRAPRTTVLPDRFVVMLYEGDEITTEVVGNIIPDELIVGPDPLDPDSFKVMNGNLVPGDAYDWTSNFDKAVALGMGFKIPLTPVQAAGGFKKLVVLGLSLSLNETDSKQQLENLIDNHHYSPNGFSLVKQGTATNNTEQDGSGYTTNDPFNNTSFFVETGDPLFTGDGECDGKILADALGIEYEPLQYVLNSNATDHKEAVAMNTALYPATLGFYFDTMLKGAIGEQTQDQLRKFFIAHVTGRGLLPSIRVGDQPYGILVTSDFSKWLLDRSDASFSLQFLEGLQKVLKHYHEIWHGLMNELMFVGKPGTDPSEVLMNILGLQAGSISFLQRVGYPAELVKNKTGFMEGGRYHDELEATLTTQRQLNLFLRDFGSDVGGGSSAARLLPLLRLVFQSIHTTLDPTNLIEKAPLSETNIIRYYDEINKKNYLHWLAETNTVWELERQNFGEGVHTPTALLYMKLRRALLLQLHNATVKFIGSRGFTLEQTSTAVNFYNIRPQGTVTKWEVLKAKVKTVEPNHPQGNIPIAEHILTQQIDQQEVLFLKEVRRSLETLAAVPTARLERCLTEHLDTCTYRLDAWETALFNLRLQRQRIINSDGGEERRKGIYIGAYAMVEDLRPAAQRVVVTDPISTRLRPPGDQPLFEYTDNGGFVHAPSLNHAIAAALLRSGYLAHANSDHPDAMAVNLSSERVRRANQILEGIRHGQSLEALLGYQFERGLHDRASADSRLARLNEFIYNFREKFPLEQHFIQQQGTGVTQTIPANSVVNGLKLAEFTGSFPGILVPTDTTPIQMEAIRAERDKLNDSLDALKDLFMSESVYHLVQGNFDRAGAMVNALRDANIPPEIDVINTPRGSHFTFTNRVTIQFETLNPDNNTSNPWLPILMTPRARMEPGLNKWLAFVVGKPDELVFKVSHTGDNESISQVVSLARLGIQPIDLIYMLGNELNTGMKLKEQAENETAASELESRIAFAYRKDQGLDDKTVVRIEFMLTQNIPGKRPLASVFLLLKMIKSLITDSRHLDAEDFDPPSKESNEEKTNPKGYDADNLLQRVQQVAAAFREHLANLMAVSITVDGVATTLEKVFDTLQASGKNLQDINFVLADPMANRTHECLQQISNFGLPDAFPQLVNIRSDESKLLLLEQARNIGRRMKLSNQQAALLLNEVTGTPAMEIAKKISVLIKSGKIILGDAFGILPLFSYNNAEDIRLANDDRAQLLRYATEQVSMDFVADEWLQNAAHVRSRLANWDCIRTLYETLHQEAAENNTLALKPVQLPYRAKDSWIAVEFPEKDAFNERFDISHDTLSVTIHGEAAFATTSKQAGLLIDDWTEIIPVREETTGITFNYDQPNVSPAQTLLLAIPPVKRGHWEWDDLLGIVNDTFLRAKLRAVEPALLDDVDKPEVGVLLPGLLASYSTYDLDFALDYRTNLPFYEKATPIIPLGKL